MLTTAGPGFEAGAVVPAGADVGAGVEGLLHAASSDAPIARVPRSMSVRRVSLDILISDESTPDHLIGPCPDRHVGSPPARLISPEGMN